MRNCDDDTTERMIELLNRLSFCSPPLSQAWIDEILSIAESGCQDRQRLWASLNSKRIWGGAASLANEALGDNEGYAAAEWQMSVRMFRDVMIELGELLQSQGDAYPDIQSWLLAFHNWNNANV